ncbi:uncharacterized protein LOC129794347 [Lutzomyia longipalpis]|uniref:uncharacterized protein LOC129794347 n=1 Tax=Lutzomyia longipalpis TaxID=7200 RepID=UPI0024847281|nr:uncharacterized protein LOC129794347 [Lutzomyia longipalpis]
MADFALSRRVILCFQLCGLHSINLSHMKDSKEVDGAMIKYRLYQLLHIIVVGANCIVVIFCPNSIMFANDPLGRFNDWIKYYAALFTSCLILTESYFRVRQLIEIFRLSGRLDGIFGSIRVDLSQESVTSYRVYIRKFLPFAAMLLLLEIWALPFFLTNTPMFNYWILTFPMLLQSRFRQLQHILYIDLCHHYARVLASNVKELAVFLNALEGTSGDSSAEYRRKFVNYRFRVLQRAHHVVWEISNCINTYFGWSQVANYAFHFLQLLADSYWLYYRFYNQSYGVGMCNSEHLNLVASH